MSPIEKVIDIIQGYIRLTAKDRNLVEERLHPQKLKKGAFLLRQGALNRVLGFMDTGLMRSYFTDQEGNEMTAGFFQPDTFCTDLYSFQSGLASQRSIEALMDCELLIVDKAAQDELRAKIEDWAYFEQHYISQMLLRKVTFQRKIANSSAQEAYELFQQTYTQAARYAPRYQIASYLGISPFTLSRIGSR